MREAKQDIERIKLGSVCVDSGQLLIADPCYLRDWKHGNFREGNNDNNYSEACNVTLSKNNGGQVFNDLAVAFATTWGDGEYEVFAYKDKNRNGRFMKIEIVLCEDNEKEG